jgi:hypothetical protein
MPTNMTISKYPEYPCLRICSVVDTKIDIDWICTWSDLLIQPETKNTAQRRKNKYIAQRRDNQIHPTRREIKTNKYVKITIIYYNEKETQFGGMILGQNWLKITPLQWTMKKKREYGC